MELVAEADAMDDTIAAGVGDGMGDGMGDGIVVIVAAGRGDGCAFNPDVDCAEDEAGSSFVSVFCDVVGVEVDVGADSILIKKMIQK